MGHKRLSPSDKTWPKCPGSPRVNANYEDTSSEAAVDGTGSHLLLELCIEHDNANHMLDKTIGEGHPDRRQGWWVKQDRIDRVNMALRYIQMRRSEIGPSLMEAESQSDPGSFYGRDDWGGTADVTIIGNRVLEVIDYKDGRGYVSEKENTQMISYVGGKIMAYIMSPGNVTIPNLVDCGFDKVRMTIVQPKTGNPIRYQELTIPEIYERVQNLAVAAAATDDPDAPLTPGDHCLWCPHGRAGNCEAKNRQGMEGLTIMNDVTNTGQSDFITAIQTGTLDLSSMGGDKLAAILDVANSVEKLIKMAKEEGTKRLKEDPTAVPGYGMVAGRNKQEWIDDEATVESKLRGMRLKVADVYPKKLITPAAALNHEHFNERQIKRMKAELIKVVEGDKKIGRIRQETSAADMFMGAAEPAPQPAPVAAPVAIDFM